MALNWGGGATGAIGGASAGSAFGPVGTGVGGALGGAAGLFSGNNDPTKKAGRYLDQIPEALRPYFAPYINTGTNELEQVENNYNQMATDPNAIIQRLGAGYKQSPGYQWKLGQGEAAIGNAAAAGGMAGTNQHQQNAGELATHLADQDFQNYLNSILGVYGSGIEGQQKLAGMGQQSATDYGNTLGSNLQSKANLAYEGGAAQNQQQSGLMSSILAYLQNPNNNLH